MRRVQKKKERKENSRNRQGIDQETGLVTFGVYFSGKKWR